MNVNSTWSGLTPLGVISRKRWIAVCASILSMAAALVSQTTVSQNRITQPVNSGELVKIAGTVHPLTRQATDLGEVSSGMPMGSLSLNIGLSAAGQAELDALLAAQQDPKSPQYHQWLTQEQYGARFGLTDADLSQVTGWLESQGFAVKSVAPSRNLITFSGTVPQVESAFRTQIHQYQLDDGTTHIANTTEISIPKALSGVVINVRGLNGFRPKPHAVKRARPDYNLGSTGEHFLSPGDWATIYNVIPIYANYTGSGMHVGVAGQTYFPLQDITNFRAAAGLSAPLLNMVCISAANCTDLAGEGVLDIGEADLDVEWSGGIAKNATVDFIYTANNDQNQDVFDALVYGITTYQVGGALLPVIGVSYGACEYDAVDFINTDAYNHNNTYDYYLQEAASQGQTIVNSSGDDGAGCSDSNAAVQSAPHGASVSWPASNPNVTAVGGTTLNGDENNPSDYWIQTPGLVDSALGYISETVWNDPISQKNGLEASGGGVSTIYSLPPWQDGLIAGQTSWRLVPDVSFAASPNHDGYLVCTQNFPPNETGHPASNPGSTCVNGFLYSDGEPTPYGGTSASAQVFSGLMTLLVQAYGKQGPLNPTLYGLAQNAATYAKVFHDITAPGNNIVPCTPPGTNGCPGDGEVGYSATTGYDLATGLGSINGGALYTALGGSAAASYTMVPSPSSVSVAVGGVNNSVQLNLTSTGYAGTVSFTTSVTLNGEPTNAVTASAESVNLASNGIGSTSLMITAGSSAANHAPALPWRSGGVVVFAVLLGAPFTLRRKRALAVLLTALTISVAGFLISCGGGGGGTSTPATPARTYKVTVTANGIPAVTNPPAPVTITVTVP